MNWNSHLVSSRPGSTHVRLIYYNNNQISIDFYLEMERTDWHQAILNLLQFSCTDDWHCGTAGACVVVWLTRRQREWRERELCLSINLICNQNGWKTSSLAKKPTTSSRQHTTVPLLALLLCVCWLMISVVSIFLLSFSFSSVCWLILRMLISFIWAGPPPPFGKVNVFEPVWSATDYLLDDQQKSLASQQASVKRKKDDEWSGEHLRPSSLQNRTNNPKNPGRGWTWKNISSSFQ